MTLQKGTVAGTYQYQDPMLDPSIQQTYQSNLGAIRSSHQKNRQVYKKIRSWADWYRTAASQSFGYGGGPATDPLVQLQQQLASRISTDAGLNLQPGAMSDLVRGQQNAQNQILQQQALGMGAGDLYQGLAGAQMRARRALSEKAEALYQPMAYAGQQQFEQQQSTFLNQIAQADLAAKKAILMSGFSV